MQTPEEQTIRRSTRSALVEIPTRLGMLSVLDPERKLAMIMKVIHLLKLN